MRIKKKMDTEVCRRFWESFPRPDDKDREEEISLPSMGDAWWEVETQLSPALLLIEDFE